jgi:predicted secreted hydrolase
MDHEFMSNTLSANQVGWDWFGLMFKDGRNLMVFSVRGVDGASVYRSASLQRGVAGEVGSSEVASSSSEVRVTPSDKRKVGANGVSYPLEWRIEVARWGIDVVVRARVSECEVGGAEVNISSSADRSNLEPRYWEGPVASEDEGVIGYLEMTGYAGRVGI